MRLVSVQHIGLIWALNSHLPVLLVFVFERISFVTTACEFVQNDGETTLTGL